LYMHVHSSSLGVGGRFDDASQPPLPPTLGQELGTVLVGL
jgi:hypothetical protein